MKITLWIAQILLALIFIFSAALKLFSFHKMAETAPGIADLQGLFIFISFWEILGAAGLILPVLTGIRPVLTAWAAAGLATIALIAGGFHFVRGEVGELPAVAVMVGLAAFIVWGRGFRKAAR